jgi:CheY-like chemotaxis protein
MSRAALLAAALALPLCAATEAQSPAAEAELAQLVADCNAIAAASAPKRRNIRACETLASEGRLSLIEAAALTAYQQHRDEQLQACLRRQVSPRGQSRGQSDCQP